MEKRPHALLLTFPGTNCERETARALETVGFTTACVPFACFESSALTGVNLIVFSGGFSYGDYIMSGRLAQLELQRKIGNDLHTFHDNGGHLLGICNGFQILTKLDLLPKGSLVENTNRRFICRWVQLNNHSPNNPFLTDLPQQFEIPIAHAEGRFVIDPDTAKQYLNDGLVTLTYDQHVNGSTERIAGLQNTTGRVFGLMPHPERFIYREQHYDPDWNNGDNWGWGYHFFKSIHQTITTTLK